MRRLILLTILAVLVTAAAALVLSSCGRHICKDCGKNGMENIQSEGRVDSTRGTQADNQKIAGQTADLTVYVDPFIGTDGMGHTFPGACVPFGGVQVSPDTDTIPHNVAGKYQPEVYSLCAGYRYSDNTITGFSHTHLSGTGHSDLGDVLLMPTVGQLHLNPGTAARPEQGYRSRFSHESETASPGYYAVTLSDYDIRAEVTATTRTARHRYTFQADTGTEASQPRHLIADLSHGIYDYEGKTLWASVRMQGDNLLTGYRITQGWARERYTYFAIRFSKPVTDYGYKETVRSQYNGFWRKLPVNRNFPEMAGRGIVCWFDFDWSGDDTLEVEVALSSTSVEGALKNLIAESISEYSPDRIIDASIESLCKLSQNGSLKPFDEIARAAAASWNKELSKLEAVGTPDQLRMLYTSLYHTMINPSIYSDVDGAYRGLDGAIHHTDGDNYTVFSLWDTYRAEHPLLLLMHPHRATDMAASMLDHQAQSAHGLLPIWSLMANEGWCMSGYHAVSVLADALGVNYASDSKKARNTGVTPDSDRSDIRQNADRKRHGLRGSRRALNEFLDIETNKTSGQALDPGRVLEAMTATSTVPYLEGLGEYMEKGYVPLEASSTGASTTLEYAYDDWTIYRTALLLGKDSLAEVYRNRALNYRNLFDGNSPFARARHDDGSWKSPSDPRQTYGEGFIEGNSYNFSFHVPHDVAGLISLMGGEERFLSILDTLFRLPLAPKYYADNEDIEASCLIGGYVHGNEPSHHIPYLFQWTSEPWRTAYWIREIMERMYIPQKDGLGGNDDCGQMSAWHIFSAMGFYPVCPGSGEYVLGAPFLPEMTLRLDNGKTFTVKAPGVSTENRYVKSVKLNGKPYTKRYITQQDVLRGGVLEFEMTDSPEPASAPAPGDLPYSLSH
ncbi:MAG: GH92 family glycosyl hydrolase [Bacteroidales bacterium]|nr:GH92 family glycosyl hydrolase [Bacteroidales bacterium]